MKNRKGTTLGRIIFTLVIIAIVSGLCFGLVYTGKRVRFAHYRQECAHNIRTINDSIIKYTTSTKGNYPDDIRPFVINIICPITQENYEDAMVAREPHGEGSYLDTSEHKHEQYQSQGYKSK